MTTLSWEALNLISEHLDPKTLAIASCVNEAWSITFSSDHIWRPICITHFPSLSSLHRPTTSYRRLYASSRQPRRVLPSALRLSMDDIFFVVDVFCGDSPISCITKSCEDLDMDPNGLFRFDFDADPNEMSMPPDELRVKWSVVLKGWKGVFTLIDCKVRERLVSGYDKWFSEQLPSRGCCKASVVAELGFRLCNRERGGNNVSEIEKVSLSLLRAASWRYVGVDDALRYLQNFLLPCHL